jgi:hypothetical protein
MHSHLFWKRGGAVERPRVRLHRSWAREGLVLTEHDPTPPCPSPRCSKAPAKPRERDRGKTHDSRRRTSEVRTEQPNRLTDELRCTTRRHDPGANPAADSAKRPPPLAMGARQSMSPTLRSN